MADERELRMIEAVDEQWRATADVASAARLTRHDALVVLHHLALAGEVELVRGSHRIGRQQRYTYLWRRRLPRLEPPSSGSGYTSTTYITLADFPVAGGEAEAAITTTSRPLDSHDRP